MRDEVERVWAFPSANIPSIAERELGLARSDSLPSK